jgi:very-short-patch-repair endonuclease
MARDWRLIERARQMRREPTEPGKRLWRNISNRQLAGYKFRRQSAVEPFLVDFLCPAKALIVEVDGETHLAEADARRDKVLERRGYTTIRFTNEDVMSNMDGVLTVILQTLEVLPDRWGDSPDSPTPYPSPEGEGL